GPRGSIPSVDRILLEPGLEPLAERYGRERVLAATREAVSDVRARLGESAVLTRPEGRDGKASDGVAGDPSDPSTYVERVRTRLAESDAASLRSVINATGVVLHTNLGRAPLAAPAVAAMRERSEERRVGNGE